MPQSACSVPVFPRVVGRGFTLIELLVVIAIIALLLSVLLPALAHAKKAAQGVREQSFAHQQIIAWQHYAVDNKDAAFTGYLPWSAAQMNNSPGNLTWLHPDPWRPGYFISGDCTKTAGMRWMAATAQRVEEVMNDPRTAADFQARSNTPTSINPSYSPPTTLYDDASTLAMTLAFHSSFGMNYVYVGGDWSHGAMPNFLMGSSFPYTPGSIGHPRNKFYVTRVSEILRPDNLLVMASSRGVDVRSAGSLASWNYGRSVPNWSGSSPVLPGFWEVLPPENRYPSSGTSPAWITSNTYKEATDPANWGFVHPRHEGKAITVMADGHVKPQTIEDLRDMRKWANRAVTAANYNP